MNSHDILEALTDMNDDILLRAAQDPPRRTAFMPRLRHLAAACLAAVVFFFWFVASDATAQDTSIRWLVRDRKHEVEYLFRGGKPAQADVPLYEAGWIPEGYTLEMDPYGPDYDDNGCCTGHDLHCDSEEDPNLWISLSYDYVVGNCSYRFGLERDAYTVETVEIGGLEGELFLENDGNIGYLCWVDKEQSLFFHIIFTADPDSALRFAEELTISEGE